MKKLLSVLLALLFVLSAFPMCIVNASDSETRLYSVYGDGMIFKQNDEITLSGVSSSNAVISAQLTLNGKIIESGEAVTDENGEFAVKMTAPAGSYDEYEITLSKDGNVFQSLKNIVFGELWLASGQSNMAYNLYGDYSYSNDSSVVGDNAKWIRSTFYAEPEQGDFTFESKKEIPDLKWVDASTDEFKSLSAVGYYFANKLQKELDVPVGFINSSLCGSSILTWLSRDSIENDAEVKSIVTEAGRYISKDSWNTKKTDQFNDITANYNVKIAPFSNMKLSGMIWYQGESDLINGIASKDYIKLLETLQKTYTKTFNYKKGNLPLIYTQLASFAYTDYWKLPDYNSEYALSADKKENRACISITDVPLDFNSSLGAIHPDHKQAVGERMADSAFSFVYGEENTFTASTLKSVKFDKNEALVTLSDTGNGLQAKGENIIGFALCGEDGKYVKADAEIISADTVKVHSDKLEKAVSVSYGYYVSNSEINLYSTNENGYAMPVSVFVSTKLENADYYIYEEWMDCDTEKTWYTNDSSSNSGYYNTWSGSDCELEFTGNALKITGNGKFSVSPEFSYKAGSKTRYFTDINTDYSETGTLSFSVKNEGNESVNLSQLRIYTSSVTWYAPIIEEGTIPADNEWHRISIDLNSLYLHGNKGGLTYSNNKLSAVKKIEFRFDSSSQSTILIDDFDTNFEDENVETRFGEAFKNSNNIFEYFCALFTELFGLISSWFNR